MAGCARCKWRGADARALAVPSRDYWSKVSAWGSEGRRGAWQQDASLALAAFALKLLSSWLGCDRWVQGKVRDVKYDAASCRLAALSTEGCIKFLDAARDLRTVRTVCGCALVSVSCATRLRHGAVAVPSMLGGGRTLRKAVAGGQRVLASGPLPKCRMPAAWLQLGFLEELTHC